MRQIGSAYVLHEQIGRGATGQVYRGITIRGGQPVAIKILRPELADQEDVVARFVRERSILTGLRSPHLVQVRDLVLEGDTLAIVMDLVNGVDLRRYLGGPEPLPPDEAVDLMIQVMDALTVVHRGGIVHRDLKPENIMVEDDGVQRRVLLTDFGIARLSFGSALTRMSSIVGTPTYLAPELAEHEHATPASDLYSAGIVLYEMLAGHPPFQAPHPVALLRAHLEQEPPPIPGVPDELFGVVRWMLAKDPAARPQSAHVTAAALADAVETFVAEDVEDFEDAAGFAPPAPVPTPVPAPPVAAPPAPPTPPSMPMSAPAAQARHEPTVSVPRSAARAASGVTAGPASGPPSGSVATPARAEGSWSQAGRAPEPADVAARARLDTVVGRSPAPRRAEPRRVFEQPDDDRYGGSYPEYPDEQEGRRRGRLPIIATLLVVAVALAAAGAAAVSSALGDGGGSDPGNGVAVSSGRLAAVSGLTAVESGIAIEVSWNPVEGASRYIVYRDGGTPSEKSETVSGTNFTDRPGDSADHVYTVAAVDEAGATGTLSKGVKANAAAPWGAVQDIASTWPTVVPATPAAQGAYGQTCSERPTISDFSNGKILCQFPSGITLVVLRYPSGEDRAKRATQIDTEEGGTPSPWKATSQDGNTTRSGTVLVAPPDDEIQWRWWNFEDEPTFAMYASWEGHSQQELGAWWQSRLPF